MTTREPAALGYASQTAYAGAGMGEGMGSLTFDQPLSRAAGGRTDLHDAVSRAGSDALWVRAVQLYMVDSQHMRGGCKPGARRAR